MDADKYEALWRWSEPEVEALITQAVLNDCGDDLQAVIQEIAICCFETPPEERWIFPDKLFRFLLLIIAGEAFARMRESHYLLFLFESDWAILTETQKADLLPLLEQIFPTLRDWVSGFVISELLGECYADERAYQCVRRLRATSAEGPRSLLPHALEHLVRDSASPDVRAKALQTLREMRTDLSSQVRGEAEISLRVLAGLGITSG